VGQSRCQVRAAAGCLGTLQPLPPQRFATFHLPVSLTLCSCLGSSLTTELPVPMLVLWLALTLSLPLRSQFVCR